MNVHPVPSPDDPVVACADDDLLRVPLRYVPDSDEIVRWVRSNGIVFFERRQDRCKAVVLDALADEPQQRTPSTGLQPERADSLVSLSSHIHAPQDGLVSHTPLSVAAAEN